eukprot:6200288-Prymnesium_polylepis.1
MLNQVWNTEHGTRNTEHGQCWVLPGRNTEHGRCVGVGTQEHGTRGTHVGGRTPVSGHCRADDTPAREWRVATQAHLA